MAKRGFFRDFMGVLNSNIVSLVSALLLVVLLTRFLGTEGYGAYNALIVIPLIAVSLTHLGIRGASIYLLGNKKYDENQLVSSVVIILIGASVAGILLSIAGFYFFSKQAFDFLLIGMVLFVIPLRLTTVYAGGVFYGKDEMRKANELNWMINLINLALAAVLVWGLEQGLTGALVASLVAHLYVAVVALRMLAGQFKLRWKIHAHIIKHLLKLGILFSMSFFVLQLNYKIDILLLEQLSTLEQVGLYSLATQIAEQLWQIPLAVSIVLFSRTANNDVKLGHETVLPLTRVVLLLVVVIAIGLFALSPWIIPLFFGKAFTSSSFMLQIILPGIVIMSVFRVLSGQIAGLGKPQVTLYIFIPALFINILLNYLWIPAYGGNGAALASDASYILGVSGYWVYYARLNHISILEIFRFKKSDFNVITPLAKKITSRWKK